MVDMMIDGKIINVPVDDERLERMMIAAQKNKPAVLICACVIREDDALLSRKKMRSR